MLLAEKEALHKEAEESRVKYEEEYKRMKEDLEKQVVGLKSDLEAATERETSLREELASAQARVEEIYENSEEFEVTWRCIACGRPWRPYVVCGGVTCCGTETPGGGKTIAAGQR